MNNLACRSSHPCVGQIYLSSFIQSYSPWFSACSGLTDLWLAFAYSIPFPYSSEVKNASAMQETQEMRVRSQSSLGRSLGGGGSSTHSSLLTWRIPGQGSLATTEHAPIIPFPIHLWLPPLHPFGSQLQRHFLSHVKTCSLCMLIRPLYFPFTAPITACISVISWLISISLTWLYDSKTLTQWLKQVLNICWIKE